MSGTTFNMELPADDNADTASLMVTLNSDPVRQTLLDRIYCQKGNPELNLTLCSIDRVPLDAMLSHYGEVQALDLSFNEIRFLPPLFTEKLATLSRLDLSRNKLKRLPDNFGDLEHLIYLDVHQNQMQTLPMSMGKMNHLQFLNLAENPLQYPLSNFVTLGQYQRENVNTASVVVKYLDKVFQDSLKYATSVDDMGPRVTFETDEEPENSHEGQGSHRRRLKRRNRTPTRRAAAISLSREESETKEEWSPTRRIMTGIVLFLFGLLLSNFIMAWTFGTPALGEFVCDHLYLKLGGIWQVYKPYHEMADDLITTIGFPPSSRSPYYPGPPPLPNRNAFQVAYYKIAGAINSMVGYVFG